MTWNLKKSVMIQLYPMVTYCVLTKFAGEELIGHLKYKAKDSPWLDIVRSRVLKPFLDYNLI